MELQYTDHGMTNSLTLQIDPRSQTIYIYLRPIKAGGVARTEKMGEGVMADLDSKGALLGVELLGIKAVSRLFSLVKTDKRFESLGELSPKENLLTKMIA